ncbi:MAG TPA: thioredoxin family protein [Bacillota bacterium]|nr:thioredoxin family protein [Bacillota bacterium]
MNINNIQAVIHSPQDFEQLLKTNLPTMALFYSSWCPFCRRFLPVFEKTAGENRQKFTFCMIIDQDALEDRFQVEIVPTVLYFEDGTVTKRLDGIAGIGIYENQLADFINTCSKLK